MTTRGERSVGSPIQEHRVAIANDTQWIEGQLETLGNPHNFLNQENLSVLAIKEPLVAPWTFTGLPSSRPEEFYVNRQRLQFLIFPGEAALTQYREPPHTETLILNLPLAVIRGDLPFLSEAKARNFLEFWKGAFVPVVRAQIHYLADTAATQPTHADLLYINRAMLQGYSKG